MKTQLKLHSIVSMKKILIFPQYFIPLAVLGIFLFNDDLLS